MNAQEYKEYQKRVEEFVEDMNYISPIYDEDGDSQEYFSWAACDCCVRPLGGTRYKMQGYYREHEYDTFAVCGDCLYYLEYGRLDDMTMMEIENDN